MLKESWFFRWATLDLFPYIRQLLILWGVGWFISSPIATVSFPFAKEPFHFGLSAAAGALFIPILVLFRLYLGWFYIRNRLYDETVVYEESGWYDGQIWEKPTEVVQRDRLIVSYQIRPILNRLQLTFSVILGCCAIGVCLWQIQSAIQ